MRSMNLRTSARTVFWEALVRQQFKLSRRVGVIALTQLRSLDRSAVLAFIQ